MDLLRRALADDPEATLDRAALELALIECPGMAPARYLDMLDAMASGVGATLEAGQDGRAFIRAINTYLFGELGFGGNGSDYYAPANSCLNLVLDTRSGIPITLSLIYMEIARRLGRQVLGIGLPGHFIVEYRDQQYRAYLDPYHGGRQLTEADCNEIALDNTQVEIARDPRALEPVGKRYILTRMLNNLRGAYFRKGEFRKEARVLDVLIEAWPAEADYYKDRGLALLRERRLSAADADFQAYLRHAPDASDRSEVVKQVEVIHRWLGFLN